MSVDDDAPALEYLSVCHDYDGAESVHDLSLTVQAGESLCLLGPSGCGKTTALRLAAGLEVPSSGEIRLQGRTVAGPGHGAPPERRNVGLVFQDYALFPHLDVAGNVAFGLEGMPAADRTARVAEVLERVGMADHAHSWPHMLSGGQQQRVALARALAPRPGLVLMDEPFSGLDARLRDAVRDRTLHVLKRLGAAMLMVTHDAEEAMYMADRIAVMRAGRIVQVGAPADLYFRPVSAFVAEFFGDVNRAACQVRHGRLDTPLGDIPAGGLADGQMAEVVVRPEAMQLAEAAPDATGQGYARVLAARSLGRSSLVHLCTCRTGGPEMHLHARVPGRYLPSEGSIQRMILDMRQVFVFPADADA